MTTYDFLFWAGWGAFALIMTGRTAMLALDLLPMTPVQTPQHLKSQAADIAVMWAGLAVIMAAYWWT